MLAPSAAGAASAAAVGDDYFERLVAQAGVTACDAAALDALRAVGEAETNRVLGTAARIAAHLGQGGTIGVEAVRLACETHQLLQPPVRERMTEMSRALNGRTQAWPLGAAVMVPAHQAAAAAFYAPGAVIEDNALRLSATGGLAVGPAVPPSQPTAAALPPAAASSSSSSSSAAAGGGDGLPGAGAVRLAAPVKLAPPAAAAGGKGGRGKGAGSSSAAVAAAFGDGGS